MSDLLASTDRGHLRPSPPRDARRGGASVRELLRRVGRDATLARILLAHYRCTRPPRRPST